MPKSNNNMDQTQRTIICTGELDIAEIETIIHTNTRHDDYDRVSFQIYDLRKVTKMNLNIFELDIVTAIEQNATQWNKNIKTAFVTSNNDIIQTLELFIKRMKQSDREIQIFPSIEAAKQWNDK